MSPALLDALRGREDLLGRPVGLLQLPDNLRVFCYRLRRFERLPGIAQDAPGYEQDSYEQGRSEEHHDRCHRQAPVPDRVQLRVGHAYLLSQVSSTSSRARPSLSAAPLTSWGACMFRARGGMSVCHLSESSRPGFFLLPENCSFW